MSNTLTVLMPRIIARGLITLRQRCVMPRLVNGDYGTDARKKGSTIDVPIPTAVGTRNVVPGHLPIAPTDATPAMVQVALDNWKQNDPFFLTDKDCQEIMASDTFIPMQMDEAIKALAADVNISIHQQYKGIYGWTGSSGTTPFGSNVTDATNARKVLNQQLVPRENRRGVLNFDAEANALALPAFSDAEKIMSAVVKMEGEIGRKYGIDWVADDHVLTHVSTPLTAGNATVNGVHAAQPTARSQVISIAKASNASPLVEGDIITFAGDSQTYVVNAAVTLAVGNTNVNISPGLKVAKAGGEIMALKATHVVNLAFHRDAFAFATRPLQDDNLSKELGNKIMTMQDPVTGLVLRLEVMRQHKQVAWEFDILWGTKLVRPELASRIAG